MYNADWGNGLTAITLMELKTIAYTVYGTQSHLLPISIGREEISHVLFQNINSYWRSWLSRHSHSPHRYLLLLSFPWFTEWSILGIARQLYTLKTGNITSKLQAGRYLLEMLPNKYHPIVQQAIDVRTKCKQYQFSPSVIRAKQTLECSQYIIDVFNATYKSKFGETLLLKGNHRQTAD